MERIIFRLDDISPNTDLFEVSSMSLRIKDIYPSSELWFSFNPFAKKNNEGSVYSDVPFKDKPKDFFYDIDVIRPWIHFDGKIVSHGLLHCDHSRLGYDAQEMSILTSCKYIGTDVFVPPFNRWNSDTSEICSKHKIRLVKLTDGWKSLEHNDFDSTHNLWYFHPWKWNVTLLANKLEGKLDSKKLGQLQGNSLCSAG